MKKVYITFGGEPYNHITQLQVQNAPRFGADEVWVYDDFWLTKTDFYVQNIWLWQHMGPGNLYSGRGFGWFAWKPFILLHALSKLQDGDMVLFTDGDTHPIADFSVLFTECQKNGGFCVFSAVGCVNRNWCKRDAYIVLGQDKAKYVDCQHAVARFMVFQKGPWRPQQFLMEWLTYCVNPLATTFDASILGPEHEGFIESRSEQAIFTLLCHKYKLRLYREACQYGRDQVEDQNLYPQLFEQVGCSSGGADRPVKGSTYFRIPGECR